VLTVANVHLNCMTAKRELQAGGQPYKDFWDGLAAYMVKYRPTYLCGDFSMAFFSVVPELRMHGFQVNLAAWYCWKASYELTVRSDSCGIFRIEPCTGIRLCYDATVFGLPSPDLPATCSMVMETHKLEEGKETKHKISVAEISFLGQGYPLNHYKPKDEKRREKFVQWTFTPVLENEDEHSDMRKCAKEDKYMFHENVKAVGAESWKWPEAKLSAQKIVSFERFDPDEKYFKGGAHMPVMIFIGGNSDTRRR
jgi:hypothetical protein